MRRITVLFAIFLVFSVASSAQSASSFVPIVPCRVADTRNANGPFGGPAIAGNTYRTFLITQSACNIPSSASAYSLNIAAIPTAGVGYLAAWPDNVAKPYVATLTDAFGAVLENSALVPAGADGGINVFVTDESNVVIDINGYFVAQSNSTSTAVGTGASNAGTQNTAMGYNALTANSGTSNTAVGASALTANSLGNNNTAVGASALFSNVLGSANTAIGTNSLLNTFAGNDNTGIGFSALNSNITGSNNVAIGASSLSSNTTGTYNVAIGMNALNAETSGSDNIALGYQAGNLVTTGNYNIDIGNTGVASDAGVIRIGTAGSQTSTYLAGVANSSVSGATVVITSNGQLGVQTSSERFKEDIADIGDASDGLMQLRPVMFRYRNAPADGSKREQYGLIAEEVDKIYPELVVRDSDGRPWALAYQELPALLLNEIQKQRRTIAAQEQELQRLSERVRALEEKNR
jgi:hypothetical protein